jgi:hypothetical protein
MAGYPAGQGNSLRMYLIDTARAPDTLNTAVLRAGSYQPAAKTLVANLDTFTAFASPGSPAGRLQHLDNTEGMAWGPRLASGQRSLVLASDDNFNTQQITQFLAFEWS